MDSVWDFIRHEGVVAWVTGQSLATIYLLEVFSLAGSALIVGVIGGFAGLLGKGLYKRYMQKYIDR